MEIKRNSEHAAIVRQLPSNRRRFVGGAAAAGLLGATPFARVASAASRKVRIGLATPKTGPLAAFAEADERGGSACLNTIQAEISGSAAV